MSLAVGIVGLPNVGKSTLFNALTRAQNAEAANYPFCTIEPNKATVPVADLRLEKLAEIGKSARIIHATVDFTDIAGLVRGASKGEGLGNQFLGNIRECDAILEVVRCFDNDDVVHVEGSVDPIRDIEIIETELVLADLQSLEKRLDRISRQARADKALAKEVDAMRQLQEHLDAGLPVRTFTCADPDAIAPCRKELHFLTDKPVIYVANVGESDLGAEDNDHVKALKAYAVERQCDTVVICAAMEADLVGLSEAEQQDFLSSYGLEQSGLDVTIQKAYHTLGLQSYFTVGQIEARAWTIRQGWTAPKAAGVIHTDFERGFIRAEVVAYDDFVALGGEAHAREKGLLRVEGKEYVMRDGDVVHFLFNV
ncbi:MAG: redox-regulated ATPase YchF [Kiritimatiellae bacterium]|nr:redox-regulated ATPase YchF [Kiritimatiellia bacterium]